MATPTPDLDVAERSQQALPGVGLARLEVPVLFDRFPGLTLDDSGASLV